MRVLFVTNVLSPYRAEFFSEFGKYCDLTVVAELDSISYRDKKWKTEEYDNYVYISLHLSPRYHEDTSFSYELVSYIRQNKKKFDCIIFGVYTDPSQCMAICYCKMAGIPYFISDDGGFVPEKNKYLLNTIKSFLLKDARACLTTSMVSKSALLFLGVHHSRIFLYPFSSIKKKQIKTMEELGSKGLKKKELDIHERKSVLYVTQFIPRKRIEDLLKVAKELKSHDIGFYIIGGKPTTEYLNMVQDDELYNVHFIEFLNFDKLSAYFTAMDCFVMPTGLDIWGLVVNEAMAHGLPVVSSDRCLAATQMIDDGVNGYVVPVGDYKLMANKIKRVIYASEEDRIKMQKASLKTAGEYTIEAMAEKYRSVLELENLYENA